MCCVRRGGDHLVLNRVEAGGGGEGWGSVTIGDSDCGVYSPEPGAEVYCLQLNFHISKLAYRRALRWRKSVIIGYFRKNQNSA